MKRMCIETLHALDQGLFLEEVVYCICFSERPQTNLHEIL